MEKDLCCPASEIRLAERYPGETGTLSGVRARRVPGEGCRAPRKGCRVPRKGCRVPREVSRGFTLVELTIVLVVIGVLAAIAIPNYIMMVSRAKESKVKENAHCVQLAVELYATQNDGIYSDADDGSIVSDIVPFLPQQQRLKNSFSGDRTEPVVGPAANPGEIGYQARVGAGGVNEGYIITGFGKAAMVITITGGF